MIASGLIVLLFVIVHVKQFKFGTFYETAAMRSAISIGPRSKSSATRCGSLLRDRTLLVGLHLRHGISSAFQSLGARPSALHAAADDLGILLAVLIGGGLGIIPDLGL